MKGSRACDEALPLRKVRWEVETKGEANCSEIRGGWLGTTPTCSNAPCALAISGYWIKACKVSEGRREDNATPITGRRVRHVRTLSPLWGTFHGDEGDAQRGKG